jgi:integrase
MNATLTASEPENVIALAIQPKPKPATRQHRFKITEFRNRAGSVSYRVIGYNREGQQLRQNFSDEAKARCKQIEWETEYLQQPSERTVKATVLDDDQLRIAEMAVLKMGEDWPHVLDAIDRWKRDGGKSIPTETPRIDDAVKQYVQFLDASTFRAATKQNWKNRIKAFGDKVENVRIAEVTPEFIEEFLQKRDVSAVGKNTDRLAVSRFFSWCIERPRRWVTANPCREVRVDQGEKGPVAVLSVAECKAMLRAAEKHNDGAFVAYLAVCLFGGLRPFEARRLTWEQVNLTDGEIRIDSKQTKTGKGRTVKICPTLAAWLKGCKGKPFFPANWRRDFAAIKAMAGFEHTRWTVGARKYDDTVKVIRKGREVAKEKRDWKKEHVAGKRFAPDVLRHTAISHYFRQSGSYGFTAEQFGNSEAIIKAHYQSRVSSADTEAFYKMRPTR